MNWTQIEPKVEKLKNGILSVMDKIEELSADSDKLPQIAGTFTAAREMIENPSFDVVVCGEVKKGKSSLLNAIVGESILPVNVEIATSQVFRIKNSNTENFCLVFTDGTKKSITREELSKYGSQVDADLHGEPIFQNHTLAYIEVNMPIQFLPQGVNLVDTPGLGAMYKSHEWITQNYVQKASAVIFVMDPERPLVEKEKEFILKVLDITPHILFAMTKIDMYSNDVIEKIIARDEELLALVYAEKNLGAPKIYPVSSALLTKVTTGKVEKLKESNLRNSCFPQIKEQLLYLIYKNVGLQQTGIALREVADHTVKSKTVIEDILKVTIANNAEEQQRIERQKLARQNELNAQWGSQSELRKSAQKEIYDICNSVTSRVQQIVSTSGSIYKDYLSKIESLSSMDEVETLSKTLPQDVVNEVSSHWNSIAQDAEMRVTAILSQVNAEMVRVGYNGINRDASVLAVSDLNMNEKMAAWRGAAFFGGIGSSLALNLGAFAIPIVGPIVGAAIGLISLLVGKSQSDDTQLQKNKQMFRSKLIELLNELSSRLLHVQGSANRSVVGEFSSDLKEAADKAIQNIFTAQKEQLQKEMDDIVAQARLDANQKQAEINKWTAIRNDWGSLVDEIKQMVNSRNEIASALGVKSK